MIYKTEWSQKSRRKKNRGVEVAHGFPHSVVEEKKCWLNVENHSNRSNKVFKRQLGYRVLHPILSDQVEPTNWTCLKNRVRIVLQQPGVPTWSWTTPFYATKRHLRPRIWHMRNLVILGEVCNLNRGRISSIGRALDCSSQIGRSQVQFPGPYQYSRSQKWGNAFAMQTAGALCGSDGHVKWRSCLY